MCAQGVQVLSYYWERGYLILLSPYSSCYEINVEFTWYAYTLATVFMSARLTLIEKEVQ